MPTVMRMMGDKQVRRLPVIDGDYRLVGIVSIGDLALRQPGHIDEAVREISEPTAPAPAPARAGAQTADGPAPARSLVALRQQRLLTLGPPL